MKKKQPSPMKIAELCLDSGLSKPTILNYLKMGLLPPAVQVASNLHLYDATHLERLREIRRLQEEKGLSLPQIKEALETGRIPEKPRFLNSKLPTPESPSQEVDPETQRRLQILDIGIRLFSKHGYGSVKIGDITDAAGIAKGTFYLYFLNKKNLLNQCFSHIRELLIAENSSEPVLKEPDIVLRMRNRWLDIRIAYPHIEQFTQLLQVSSNSDDAEIREKALECYNALVQGLISDITETKENGLLSADLDPKLAAYAVTGVFHSMSFWMDKGSISMEVAAVAVEKFTRGILFPPAKSRVPEQTVIKR
ncbi:MAG: TetR family transcriptional regulator [Desulfuromonadaceae bacterium]|nr:TetR family transcriptional regulator [Desulfuromonadaceae bacterium]